MLTNWGVWISWLARPHWTKYEVAHRTAASLQLLHRVLGVPAVTFEAAGTIFDVADPEAAKLIAAEIDDRQGFPGDLGLILFPEGDSGFHISLHQVIGAGDGPFQAWFEIEFTNVEPPRSVPELISGLCEIWEADSGWMDFVHVRQEWNDWNGHNPVVSWATWLSSRYNQLDLSDVPADVTTTPAGQLIVLKCSMDDVADPSNSDAQRLIETIAAEILALNLP